MLRALLLGIPLCTFGLSFADTLKSESELRLFADRVMGTLEKGGTMAAFAAMKPYTIIPGSEFDSIALASKSQREQFGARFGKTVGFEFIGQKKLGESLIRLTYIEKTEKHAFPWRFYFYKTPSGWALNSFLWNDQMPQLFQVE
jgi:hypothetical protein